MGKATQHKVRQRRKDGVSTGKRAPRSNLRLQAPRKEARELPGGRAVKDPVLSLPWHRFDPWPGNFCMPQVQPKKKMKKKKKEAREQRSPQKLELGSRLCASLHSWGLRPPGQGGPQETLAR